jgi:hypothetical protein
MPGLLTGQSAVVPLLARPGTHPMGLRLARAVRSDTYWLPSSLGVVISVRIAQDQPYRDCHHADTDEKSSPHRHANEA